MLHNTDNLLPLYVKTKSNYMKQILECSANETGKLAKEYLMMGVYSRTI